MTTHLKVPADVEADDLSELIDDCQWLAMVAPSQHLDLHRLPAHHGWHPVEISDFTAHLIDGYAEYGG